MKKLHQKIVNAGFVSGIDGNTPQNKRVKLLNYYALIWFYLSIFFTIADAASGILQKLSVFGYVIKIYVFIALATVIFLNQKHYFSSAKVLFMVTAFVAMNASSLIISPGIFTEYYFFLIIGFGLSLYDKKWVAVLCLIGAVFCFFLPYHVLEIYPKEITNRILYSSILGLFVALYFLINYFKKLNGKNEQLLALERDKVLSDQMILKQQEQKLRELNEFKSHFFVNLSHEIRTPLTLIKGYTRQLNTDDISEENIKKLKVIEIQATKMQGIIDDIMDLSKLDAHELTINKKFTDIYLFLSKIFTHFKPLFQEQNIVFDFESTIVLPIEVSMDVSLFEKAITNLLSNALKFTPKNGKVTLTLKQEEQGITIAVTDTGIGIPEEHISKLFDRFYQVKNDITKSKGSGIGLAFVKSILDHHNFTIKVTSKIDMGSKFTIKICKSATQKKAVLTSEMIVEPSVKKLAKTTAVTTNKKLVKQQKVLVVDDHKQMRTYIKSILSAYEITEAADGKEALKLMNVVPFDLVVTDYMMPVMDGEALVKAIKQKGWQIPIVVLTARTDNEGKLKMLRLGVDGYLFKPFLEEELKMQVANGIKLFNTLNSFKQTLPKEENVLFNKQATKFNAQIKTFIEQNLNSENFKVEDVAAHFNISSRTLNRKAKALLGQSVQELILEARLVKVKELLNKDPDFTKSEITSQVGLKNTSYLFQKYEERFGVVV